MKEAIFISLLFAGFLKLSIAQSPIHNGFAFSYQLSNRQNDFGMGLNVLSPYFAKKSLAVRLNASIFWHQHRHVNNISKWSLYPTFNIAFRHRAKILEDKLYAYTEGGFVLLLPNAEFSNEKIDFGGYGLFGLEFYSARFVSYFIELGGIGTGAREKGVGQNLYSTGFMANAGVKFTIPCKSFE